MEPNKKIDFMSNFVYGYVETSNLASAIKDVEQIVASQSLGLITLSSDGLYDFPSSFLPRGDNALIFSICASKQSNTAEYLLESLDFVADLPNSLPREARKRRELLLGLISEIFNLEQVEKLYIVLIEVQGIEAVASISLEDLKEKTLNHYEGPPNVLYIVEKP